jgi:hypothetical protein
MRFVYALALTAMLAGGVAGCGGGGGGGGGGAGAGGVDAPAPASTGITVNGVATASDGSGAYVVQPGDKVELGSSQSANWSTSSDVAGAITLRNANITNTKWSAQITNSATGPVSYTVSWTAAGSARKDADATKDGQSVVLKIAAGDVRNGTYTAFEPNGTQQSLVLDFNALAYDMINPAGDVHSGVFTADASESGTYVFASSRIIGPVNPARFRVTTDAVVGGFPFQVAASNPATYSVQPFVAARAWTATAAELDGNYNRFSVYTTPTGPDSTIGTLKIANGGTTMVVCNDNIIYPIDTCPVASQITYTVAKGPAPGQWVGTNVANPDPEQGATFYMARIGGQNVYLRASYSTTTTTRFLRIALPDTAVWPSATGHSISTTSTWGTTTVTASTYERTRVNPDGTVGTINYAIAPAGPLGLRSVNQPGPDHYFAMQSSKLIAVVGARTNPNTVGNLSIALVD